MNAIGEISIYISIYFTLILIQHVVIVNTTGTSFPKLFSRGTMNVYKIRASIGVSVASCEEECSRRRGCHGVIYKRRTTSCVLAANLQTNQAAANGRGTILITGLNFGTYTGCGTNTCTATEACIEEGNGYICKTKECGPLPSFYTTVQGNMNAITNKLIIRGGPSDTRVTCGDNGLWEKDSSYTNVSYDCTDVFGTSGVYMLSSSGRDVYCDMETDQGHWLLFQRRQDGTVDFERNWVDYVAGFGNLNGEFWLGLESLYQIIQTGQFELRVDLESFSGERRFAKYTTFSVAGSQDNYRLTVTGYTGNAGDSLNVHNGMMFSTVDKDNDNWPSNCAAVYKGCWWYNACHRSNLNGVYFHGGQTTPDYASNINWYTWLGHRNSLKATEMKIRRKWN